jgi:uncharacterized protein DUF4159
MTQTKNRPLVLIALSLALVALIVSLDGLVTTTAQPTTQYAPGVSPATSSTSASTAPSVSYDQIDQSIRRGIDFLLSNFDKFELKHVEGELGQMDHDGINDLCVYSLLKAGQSIHDQRLSPESPFVRGVLERMKRQRLDSNPSDEMPVVYARAMRAAALAVYHRRDDHRALEEDVQWLIRSQRDGGYVEDDQFDIAAIPVTSPGEVVAAPSHSRNDIAVGPWFRTGGGGYGMPMHHCVPSRGQAITSASPSGGAHAGHSGAPTGMGPRPPMHMPGAGTGKHTILPQFAPDPTRADQSPATAAPAATATRPSQFPFDNFDSQIGLFGVWAGADAGIEVPTWYWQKTEGHWQRYEMATGQWYYTDFDYEPTIGMTWAGTWSLLATHDRLGLSQKQQSVGKPPYSAGLQQALKWLETADNCTTLSDPRTMYVGYNLYLLDLIGHTSGFKFLGAHDWYREIAARVLAVQWPNGSFGRSPYGIDPVIQTAYTVLFLAGGRNPVFIQKLRFNGAWANRSLDLGNLTRFASSQLERTLNWQVVPLDRDWTDWLDSPVLYIASHDQLPLAPDDVKKLRSYVESGGMLFTHADAGSDAFTIYVEQTLAPQLFPAYKMQDIPENDPIYSAQYHLKSPLPKLRGVSNGSRWLLVHSPTDLAWNWQTRNEKAARSSFELGVNLYVCAAGKGDLQNRAPSPYLPQNPEPPANSISVVRLKYEGNWDPEPQAWTRFDRWMRSNASTGIAITVSTLDDLAPGAAPLAIVTGTSDYSPSGTELAAVKRFVESGGWLLIDDCGGGGKFAGSVQTGWLAKLTDEKPAPLADDDPLLAGVSLKYREGTTERFGGSLKPSSVSIGKGRILFSRMDLTTGLLGANTWGVLGYDPSFARAFVRNLLIDTRAHAAP